jgi:hypothetical protein
MFARPFIFFCLIIAFIAGVFWFASLAIYWLGRRKKKSWLMWLGGVLLALITTLGIVTESSFAYSVVRDSIPRFVFEDTFHETPSPAIAQLHTHKWSFANPSDCFIQFIADKQTFTRLLPPELKQVSREEFDHTVKNDEVLSKWWTPLAEGDEIWLFQNREYFGTETLCMTYNETTHVVHYLHVVQHSLL